MTKTHMRKPIGIALIGAGMIAKTHVAALSAAQDVAQLRAIISRRPERARKLAEFYDGPAPLFSDDLSAVAADPTVQIAIVATPPSVRKDASKHLRALARTSFWKSRSAGLWTKPVRWSRFANARV